MRATFYTYDDEYAPEGTSAAATLADAKKAARYAAESNGRDSEVYQVRVEGRTRDVLVAVFNRFGYAHGGSRGLVGAWRCESIRDNLGDYHGEKLRWVPATEGDA